jgi:hypothetical protein
MKIQKPKVEINGVAYEIYGLEEFKELIGNPDISTPTLDYNMRANRLDYTQIGHVRFIIYNSKAQVFEQKFKERKRSAITF